MDWHSIICPAGAVAARRGEEGAEPEGKDQDVSWVLLVEGLPGTCNW